MVFRQKSFIDCWPFCVFTSRRGGGGGDVSSRSLECVSVCLKRVFVFKEGGG